MDEKERVIVDEMFRHATLMKQEVDSFKKTMNDVTEQNKLLRKFMIEKNLWNEYEIFVRRYYDTKKCERDIQTKLSEYTR